MAFRDDLTAARARADALERRVAELETELEGRAGTRDDASGPTRKARGGSPWVLVGLTVAVGAMSAGIAVLGSPPAGLMLGGVGMATLMSVAVLRRLIVVVGPSEIAVLSGRPSRSAGGEVRGYRTVVGGRAVRLPIVERVDWLDASAISLGPRVHGAYTRGGIPVTIEAAAVIRIATTEPVLHNAVERFVGRDRDEIRRVATETFEGALRGIAAQLTIEELRSDRLKVAESLSVDLEHDLSRLGLVMDVAKILRVVDERDSSGD